MAKCYHYAETYIYEIREMIFQVSTGAAIELCIKLC